MKPASLAGIIQKLPRHDTPDLLVGLETMDDAGVYRLTPDLAMVQTVDFFFPVVNDPRAFGRIAAANSLSDIWAMGGKALTAMNVLAYPAGKIPPEIIQEMLIGGSEKLAEAEVALVGGHTMEQDNLLYGMSVTGTVHPDHIMTNSQPRVGDTLILTKPLGTGIYANAHQADGLNDKQNSLFIASMERLNKYAAEAVVGFDISAMTDVTGFGLLGHAFNLARNGCVTIHFSVTNIPCFPDTFALMEHYNAYQVSKCEEWITPHLRRADTVTDSQFNMMAEAQTSGGLLIAVREDEADTLIASIEDCGDIAVIVGVVDQLHTMDDGKDCYLNIG
ncbi:selenide, water dikinase SelD [bacterium]|nr:selenide, water dikinase SelD [bacterium]